MDQIELYIDWIFSGADYVFHAQVFLTRGFAR